MIWKNTPPIQICKPTLSIANNPNMQTNYFQYKYDSEQYPHPNEKKEYIGYTVYYST